VSEIGIETYAPEYTTDLLKQRLKAEIGVLSAFGSFDESIYDAVANLTNQGFFVAKVLDDYNLGVCRGAFLSGKTLELALRLTATPDCITVVGGVGAIKVYGPRQVRDILQKNAGAVWATVQGVAIKMVDNLYKNGFVFIHADSENAEALRKHFKEADNFTLRVRLQGEKA
jgi:hypothetical protein